MSKLSSNTVIIIIKVFNYLPVLTNIFFCSYPDFFPQESYPTDVTYEDVNPIETQDLNAYEPIDLSSDLTITENGCSYSYQERSVFFFKCIFCSQRQISSIIFK